MVIYYKIKTPYIFIGVTYEFSKSINTVPDANKHNDNTGATFDFNTQFAITDNNIEYLYIDSTDVTYNMGYGNKLDKIKVMPTPYMRLNIDGNYLGRNGNSNLVISQEQVRCL